MAAVPFTYQGASYTVDDTGRITRSDGGLISPAQAADVALAQAAAQAQSGTAPTEAPQYGQVGEPSVSGLGTGGSDNAPPPPPAAPATPAAPAALPAAPPRSGVGSATELRAERDRVQKQIDEIQAKPAVGPGEFSNAQMTALTALNTRMGALTTDITKNETPIAKAPTIVSGPVTPQDQWIVHDNGDGTVTKDLNPTWDGTTKKPQNVTIGNKVINVAPDGKVTVAYTDTDAQQLATRQTAVGEANSRVAAAAQATNDMSARAAAEIAERVSKGEDAASVRADLAQQLTAKHQEWVEADGDARRAQEALTAYSTERRALAQEKLSQAQIDATAKAQERQDATARYGYDKAAETSKYSTDIGAHTAKMNAANTMFQNSLSMLAEVNKALPPGSDLAGKALEGMLAYGTKFLNGFSGEAPKAPGGPDEPPPGAPLVPVTPPDQSPPGSTSATPPAETTPETTPTGPNPVATSDPYGNAASSHPWSPNQGQALGDPYMNSASAHPMPNLSAIDTTSNQLAAANAAAHAATMAAPAVALHPDGSPIAGPADVARLFNRGGTA